jgi:hypothetical protein
MKTNVKGYVQGQYLILALMILCCAGLHGCGINAAINKIDLRLADAIHSMDKAIASLNTQSANWQTVITDLQEEISDEMQSTISVEIENLTRNAVLTAGGEVRCNAEFMRRKLRRELIDMRNSLAQSLNKQLVKFGGSAYQFDLTPQDPIEPFICDIVPSAVDLSVDPERRQKIDIYGFDLRSMPIFVSYRSYGMFQASPSVGVKEYKAEMAVRASRPRRVEAVAELPRITENIRMNSFTLFEPWKLFSQDVSGSISVLSDFHAVIDLTNGGAALPPTASEIILSWNNKLQSEIPILTHIQTLDCRSEPKPLAPGLAQTYTPPHTGSGDRDFYGHGPCMRVNMSLELDAAKRNLYATFTVSAFECNANWSSRKDHTKVYGTKRVTLFTANEDESITGFDAATSFSDSHRDTGHNSFFTYYSGTAPVEKIEWIGDTKGDEAGTKTGVVITFRQFNVNVQRCVYK